MKIYPVYTLYRCVECANVKAMRSSVKGFSKCSGSCDKDTMHKPIIMLENGTFRDDDG